MTGGKSRAIGTWNPGKTVPPSNSSAIMNARNRVGDSYAWMQGTRRIYQPNKSGAGFKILKGLGNQRFRLVGRARNLDDQLGNQVQGIAAIRQRPIFWPLFVGDERDIWPPIARTIARQWQTEEHFHARSAKPSHATMSRDVLLESGLQPPMRTHSWAVPPRHCRLPPRNGRAAGLRFRVRVQWT